MPMDTATDNTPGRQRGINLNSQCFAVEVINGIERPDMLSTQLGIAHEVH